MKRLILLIFASVALAIVGAAVSLVPRFRNMGSEYGTIEAIGDLKEYLRTHDGQWPSKPEDLGSKYPVGGRVYVDYSMTASRLIENPLLLKDAVRPCSGRFYTYPHYDEKIHELHVILLETNQSDPRVGNRR